jgi:hypothetical protein
MVRTFGSRVLPFTDGIGPASCMGIFCSPAASHGNEWSDHVVSQQSHRRSRSMRSREMCELTWERYSTGGNQEVECQQGDQKTQSRCPLHCRRDLFSSAVLSLKLSMDNGISLVCCLHVPCTLLGEWQCPGPLFIAHVMQPRSFV